METTTDTQFNTSAPARPQFLSVLCILTWICCALLFITSLWGVLMKPSPEEQMEQALDSQSGGAQVLNTVLTLVCLGLSAFGAYLMWQLKKKGFYIYLAGELLAYLGFAFGGAESMGAMGTMAGMSGAAMVGIVIGVLALFDGVFIALYAMNVKHMTAA